MKYRTRLTLLVFNKDRSNHLRGETEVVLPFHPTVGIHIQIDGMHPIKLVKVIWQSKEEIFHCIAEEEVYEFNLDTEIETLTDDLDILRDARQLGWAGFDKIYKDK